MLFVVALFVAFGFGREAQTVAKGLNNSIDFVEVSGYIDPPTLGYLERRIEAANREGSQAVIVRLDTSGTLSVSVNDLVDTVLDSEVPVIVWIAPSEASARSGGFALALAAHVLVMSPSSSLGPGAPLNLSDPDAPESSVPKLDASGVPRLPGPLLVRALAAARGRNPDEAERAFSARRALMAEEAVASNLADFVAGSPKTLLDTLDGREVSSGRGSSLRLDTSRALVRFHKMSVWERILHSSINPEVAYYLVLFGFFGLIFELYHPGLGAAGLLGGGSLALGIYALSVLPAEWFGLAVVALAVVLFLRDLHTGSFGIFTVVGTLALTVGSFLLFGEAVAGLRLSPLAVVAALLITLLFFVSVMTAAIRARLARPAPESAR